MTHPHDHVWRYADEVRLREHHVVELLGPGPEADAVVASARRMSTTTAVGYLDALDLELRAHLDRTLRAAPLRDGPLDDGIGPMRAAALAAAGALVAVCLLLGFVMFLAGAR